MILLHKESVPARMQEMIANRVPYLSNVVAASDEGVTTFVTTAEVVVRDDSASATGELAAFSTRAVGEDRGAREALVVMRKPWLSYCFGAVASPGVTVTSTGKPCWLNDVTTSDPPAAAEPCGKSPGDEVGETGGDVTCKGIISMIQRNNTNKTGWLTHSCRAGRYDLARTRHSPTCWQARICCHCSCRACL